MGIHCYLYDSEYNNTLKDVLLLGAMTTSFTGDRLIIEKISYKFTEQNWRHYCLD
ncbi:hypothetical protein [Tolypothrix sp. VBCCA 56010]|uniref:hypothetical protein n=1 Tax=Tolypothrix sp. VBCCA 56010 TaxID=3137731 RepID=UPI003D7C3FBB